MKVVRIIGAILLGLIGLVLLLYVIGVVVNWRDRPQSAEYLEVRKILADRPTVADESNGFVFVMGFSVPESEDPQAAGALRAAWIEAVNRDPSQIDADPVKKDVDFRASRSQSMERLAGNCGEDLGAKCRDAFMAALPQPRMTLQDLQLTRYRELLRRTAWREVVPFDIRVPIARFGDIMDGQRLFFVDLAMRAKTAPPGELSAAMRDDLAFWRETLKSADYLITKMIAVAAIRQHFLFGNLVLRELPTDRAEVIEAWSVPFSTAELSMRRTMAGELTFLEGTMLEYQNASDGYLLEPDAEDLTLPGRVASSLARPFYQHQDQMNHFAAQYLDFAKRFEAPLDQYAQIAENMEAAMPDGVSFHVYNPVGHVLRGLGTTNFSSYAIRVGSIEGQRRAALLTAQLRERGVSLEQMTSEVSGAALRDPFDGKAFAWDENTHAVIHTGPDAEGTRKLHPYFY